MQQPANPGAVPFDRSQFQGSNAQALADMNNQANSYREEAYGVSGSYLSLKPGNNYVRIFPPHGGGLVYTVPRAQYFLPEVRQNDNGSQEIKQKAIFSALYHTDRSIVAQPRCVIGEYRDFCFAQAKKWWPSDKASRERYLMPLIGNKTVMPMKMSETWPVYARVTYPDGSTDYGLLELKKSVKGHMDKLAQMYQQPGQALNPDMFSHPDTGMSIVVLYNDKATQAADYYTTGFAQIENVPLTDAELQWLTEQDPLHERFFGVYTKRDFELALAGLQLFDQQNNMNVFATPEFQGVVAGIAQLPWPEPKQDLSAGAQPVNEMFQQGPPQPQMVAAPGPQAPAPGMPPAQAPAAPMPMPGGAPAPGMPGAQPQMPQQMPPAPQPQAPAPQPTPQAPQPPMPAPAAPAAPQAPAPQPQAPAVPPVQANPAAMPGGGWNNPDQFLGGQGAIPDQQPAAPQAPAAQPTFNPGPPNDQVDDLPFVKSLDQMQRMELMGYIVQQGYPLQIDDNWTDDNIRATIRHYEANMGGQPAAASQPGPAAPPAPQGADPRLQALQQGLPPAQ